MGGDCREVLGAIRHRQPVGALFPGRELVPWAWWEKPILPADTVDLIAKELIAKLFINIFKNI